MPTLFEQVLAEAQAGYQGPALRLVSAQPALNWAKAEHLLYLPILDATRPRALRYVQGDGLLAVSGIAYRFGTIDQFLNALTRLRVGTPLAEALTARMVNARYASDGELTIYVDPHEKPHWTSQTMPCGRVAMLERVMPCTRQVVVSDAAGYVLCIVNRPGDHHLTHDLPALEGNLERLTARRVTLTVADREANSLARTYAESSHHHLLSLLDADQYQGLVDFTLLSAWEPVPGEADEIAAVAVWADSDAHSDDPRCFYLICDDQGDLQAVYSTTLAPDELGAVAGRAIYRRRWACQENGIKGMVGGANLNQNYGYTCHPIPNRTALRQQAKLQARVEVIDRQLAANQRALLHHQERQAKWTARYTARRQGLEHQLAARQTDLAERLAGKPAGRVGEQIAALHRQIEALTAKHQQRLERIQSRSLDPLLARRAELEAERQRRQAAVEAVDVERPMFERDLEKDQIMTNWQATLLNLHHWCQEHYLPEAWRTLRLETATKLLYRKRGRVRYTADRIEVTLEAYEYRPDQEAAEEACQLFNAHHIRDYQGRLIQMAVAPYERFVRRL